MGLGAIEYAIHRDRKPGLLVVTDIDEARLERAAAIYTVEDARKNGVKLIYVNTADEVHDDEYLKSLTPEGAGFNDVFVFAPVRQVVEQADRLMAHDGCLNFFAGPTSPEFSAEFNFYNVHYAATHVVGLDAVIETTLKLPDIPGGKKLIYNHVSMPLVALDDLHSTSGDFYQGLAEIVGRHNGIWSPEAENYVLANAPRI